VSCWRTQPCFYECASSYCELHYCGFAAEEKSIALTARLLQQVTNITLKLRIVIFGYRKLSVSNKSVCVVVFFLGDILFIDLFSCIAASLFNKLTYLLKVERRLHTSICSILAKFFDRHQFTTRYDMLF